MNKRKVFVAILFCLIIGMGRVDAQTIKSYFKDENFWKCLRSNYNVEDNTDENDFDLSIIVNLNCFDREISDASGIEKLSSLKNLYLQRNNLTTIDLSKNTLLKILDLSDNTFETIDLSKNTELTSVSLNNNDLTTIDVSNNMLLHELYLYNNPLNTIYASKNSALEVLGLENNEFLKKLNINGIGNKLLISDYIVLPEIFSIEYKIDDESIAKYDESTGEIIALKEGETTAILKINGAHDSVDRELDSDDVYVEFESTITVTSENINNDNDNDNNTNSENKEDIKNPDTGVRTFAFVNIIVIIAAVTSYVMIRNKNKIKKI